MDPISRRQMLAATAAGGLLATTTVVNAQTGPFQSKPGDGGVARQATELPPGDKVAYHDPTEVADMPDFRFSLDGSRPKVTSGGWHRARSGSRTCRPCLWDRGKRPCRPEATPSLLAQIPRPPDSTGTVRIAR